MGNTMLVNHMTDETRDKGGILAYDKAFKKTYTKISAFAVNTTSYHRIVQYDFAELKLLVRFSVDAFFQRIAFPQIDMTAGPLVHTVTPSLRNRPSTRDPADIRVLNAGSWVPHEALVNIQTRRPEHAGDRKNIDYWISQVPNRLEARSRIRSRFQDQPVCFNEIGVEQMELRIAYWEKENAIELQKLHIVLKNVIKVTKEAGVPCILTYKSVKIASQGRLMVSKAGEGEVRRLPKDLEALFS